VEEANTCTESFNPNPHTSCTEISTKSLPSAALLLVLLLLVM